MNVNGLHFETLAAITNVDAVTALDTYFVQAHGKQNISGYGLGEAVNYRVLDDMPGITRFAGAIYIGLVRNNIHWLTTDAGLPLYMTNTVYQIINKFNFEQNIPMHTPAMGVPRTARQSSTTEIAKLEPLTQSFRIDGEAYARSFDSIEVVAGLSSAANGIAAANAREAYGAILFGKSINPFPPIATNTENELLSRAVDEGSLFAILHKRQNAFNYLTRRAQSVMQSSPTRMSANVAIVPFGKMAALTSTPGHTHYYLAGDIGPKRVRNGQLSDVDTGLVKDGDDKPLVMAGVEVKEAPFVVHFDTSAELMSRSVFTGDWFLFSPPENAYFGSKGTLPWADAFSPEKDCRKRIQFEDMFKKCGFFKQVPGARVAQDEDAPQYNDDPSTYLWVVNEEPFLGMPPDTLPRHTKEANPFVYSIAGPNGRGRQLVVRDWCIMQQYEYIDDLPAYWPIIPISPEEHRNAALMMSNPNGTDGRPRAPYNLEYPGNWPHELWMYTRNVERNVRNRRWNYNIARLGRGVAPRGEPVAAPANQIVRVEEEEGGEGLANGAAELNDLNEQHAQAQVVLARSFEALRAVEVQIAQARANNRAGQVDELTQNLEELRGRFDDARAEVERLNDLVAEAQPPQPQAPQYEEEEEDEQGVGANNEYHMRYVGPVHINNDERVAITARRRLLQNYRMSDDRWACVNQQTGNIKGMTMAQWAERLDFLIFRPCQESFMQDLAYIRSGPELGKTFMSEPMINVGHDVTINSWTWVIQYRSVAVVINPDLVTVFRNVLYDGMGTGNNADVMTFEQASTLKDESFVMREGAPSMYAIPMPKKHINFDRGANVVSPVFDRSRTIIALAGIIPLSSQGGASEPHYPGYVACNHIFGWDRTRISRMNGNSTLPIAPLMFKSDLTWPTANGEVTEECHSVHGRAAVGVREVRMFGRSLNPTATLV